MSGLEFGQRALLIGPHEARVASHIGRKDGGQTPFNTRVGHIHYLRGLHINLRSGARRVYQRRCPEWVKVALTAMSALGPLSPPDTCRRVSAAALRKSANRRH